MNPNKEAVFAIGPLEKKEECVHDEIAILSSRLQVLGIQIPRTASKSVKELLERERAPLITPCRFDIGELTIVGNWSQRGSGDGLSAV